MSFVAEASVEADLFHLHAAQTRRFPYLMESVARHPDGGRFDLLFESSDPPLAVSDPFAALDAVVEKAPLLPAHPLLPFVGGWVVMLAYEALQWVEPRAPVHPPQGRIPTALLARCASALIRDRLSRRLYAVSEVSQAAAEALLALALSAAAPARGREPLATRVVPENASQFLSGVARIHDYLAAGDVFQVNLSRAWRAPLVEGASAHDIYAALRRHNPAPFAASLHGDGWAVLSSSPERLVKVSDGMIETRPIAGTRPRNGDIEADRAAREALLASAKERAEHIMLIDLERNDLGRVCLPGSVVVDELMALETYEHVHHLVSCVRGRLRPGIGAGRALRAVFPGGTITGCPKVRCMEIIHQLESGPRGAYTGTVGFLSRCGHFDSNILIRTLSVEGGAAAFRVGAGIVSDSIAEAELAETDAKARGLLLALGGAR